MYKSKYISNSLTEEEEAPSILLLFFCCKKKNLSLPELRPATKHQNFQLPMFERKIIFPRDHRDDNFQAGRGRCSNTKKR